MARKLEEIVDISKSEWLELAYRVIRATVDLIRNKKYFRNKPYSQAYKQRKQQRKAAPKGTSQSSVSGVPDMTLTGKILDAMMVLGYKHDGVVIGWDARNTRKIYGNREHGRDISPDRTHGLLPPVDNLIDNEVEKLLREHNNDVDDVKKLKVKL